MPQVVVNYVRDDGTEDFIGPFNDDGSATQWVDDRIDDGWIGEFVIAAMIDPARIPRGRFTCHQGHTEIVRDVETQKA